MLKLVKVFPVEIGKEGFPFKKQQESQMKVFVQKLRIRFNLLLCRWCSKSLWIRFLLQIHHNFQVFGWKWGFDEISNDIFQCIQQVRRFSFRNKDIVAKYLGVDIISKWEWQLLTDMLRKRFIAVSKVTTESRIFPDIAIFSQDHEIWWFWTRKSTEYI